jgi:lambda family phage portal protein
MEPTPRTDPQLNWLDRTVAWFSPSAGFRRAQNRIASQILLSYEGAKTGRRTANWVASNTNADAEISLSLQTLRNRSSDLIRNEPHAARAASVVVNSAVGTGIIPRANTGNLKLDDAINSVFDPWSQQCDADGQLDFYGITQLNTRAIFERGAALIRKRLRRVEDNLPVPLQIQTLECDYIDFNQTTNTSGGITVNGVEYDAIGRRAAYWLYDQHPGANYPTVTSSWLSKRIPADQIVHAYRKDRAGQTHGVPWLAPVMILMRDMNEYSDALIVAAKIAACMALAVTQPEGAAGAALGVTENESGTNKRIETFRPGMVIYTRPGEEVTPIVPPSHGGTVEYLKYLQHLLAIGVDLHYTQLSGDLSAVNYSSFRAGDRDFRGTIEAFRWLCVIPMMLQPVWNWFIDAAYVARKIPEQNYGVIWTPPQFMSVDPVKDANADEIDMSNGMLAWPEAVARKGYDPTKQLEQIAEYLAKFDKAGIIFGFDRRKVAATGVLQKSDAQSGASAP